MCTRSAGDRKATHAYLIGIYHWNHKVIHSCDWSNPVFQWWPSLIFTYIQLWSRSKDINHGMGYGPRKSLQGCGSFTSIRTIGSFTSEIGNISVDENVDSPSIFFVDFNQLRLNISAKIRQQPPGFWNHIDFISGGLKCDGLWRPIWMDLPENHMVRDATNKIGRLNPNESAFHPLYRWCVQLVSEM